MKEQEHAGAINYSKETTAEMDTIRHCAKYYRNKISKHDVLCSVSDRKRLNLICKWCFRRIKITKALLFKPTFNNYFRLQCRKTFHLLRVMEMVNRLDFCTIIRSNPVVFKDFTMTFFLSIALCFTFIILLYRIITFCSNIIKHCFKARNLNFASP